MKIFLFSLAAMLILAGCLEPDEAQQLTRLKYGQDIQFLEDDAGDVDHANGSGTYYEFLIRRTDKISLKCVTSYVHVARKTGNIDDDNTKNIGFENKNFCDTREGIVKLERREKELLAKIDILQRLLCNYEDGAGCPEI